MQIYEEKLYPDGVQLSCGDPVGGFRMGSTVVLVFEGADFQLLGDSLAGYQDAPQVVGGSGRRAEGWPCVGTSVSWQRHRCR